MHTRKDTYCAQCHTMCEFRVMHAIHKAVRETCTHAGGTARTTVACDGVEVEVCTQCGQVV
jgi:hypothetical protein